MLKKTFTPEQIAGKLRQIEVLNGKEFLRAIDYRTGKIAWEHPIGEGAGIGPDSQPR